MRRGIIGLVLAVLGAGQITIAAQELKVFGRTIQVHGFAAQGYVYTSGNNWLTMNTNGDGSAGFTEMGLNASVPITDKFRFSAQVYDRNLGQIGQYHPSLDFAVADYRFKPWLGVRVGKVKTTLGLYTDSQDLDFVHTFALMPQGIYPLDLRDSNIAHTGTDVYGNLDLGRRLGTLSYTGYVGERRDSIYSGYEYFLHTVHNYTIHYGGLQYGGDVRWQTPVKGLLVGASRLEEDLRGFSLRLGVYVHERSLQPDFTNQFYGHYVWRKFKIDAENKRYYRHHSVKNGTAQDALNVHAWYVAGSYRALKRLELGTYYSHYTMTSTFFNLYDTNLPAQHDYDKVVSARVDINRYWNVKFEGHFMDGYGFGPYPNGFYPQQNPTFVPNTNAFVCKTSFNF